MNEGRKQSHNSPTTAKSFLIFVSGFAVFGLSLEMWIVDTSFLMRISFGHNKTVVVFAVTQLLSAKTNYSVYTFLYTYTVLCVCVKRQESKVASVFLRIKGSCHCQQYAVLVSLLVCEIVGS